MWCYAYKFTQTLAYKLALDWLTREWMTVTPPSWWLVPSTERKFVSLCWGAPFWSENSPPVCNLRHAGDFQTINITHHASVCRWHPTLHILSPKLLFHLALTVTKWMSSNLLCLNPCKIEFVIIAKHQEKVPEPSICLTEYPLSLLPLLLPPMSLFTILVLLLILISLSLTTSPTSRIPAICTFMTSKSCH